MNQIVSSVMPDLIMTSPNYITLSELDYLEALFKTYGLSECISVESMRFGSSPADLSYVSFVLVFLNLNHPTSAVENLFLLVSMRGICGLFSSREL